LYLLRTGRLSASKLFIPWCLLRRTIKYKSALARDSFDFETLGAAIVGSSSPGILCLLVGRASRCRKDTGMTNEKRCEPEPSRLPTSPQRYENFGLRLPKCCLIFRKAPRHKRQLFSSSFPVARRSGSFEASFLSLTSTFRSTTQFQATFEAVNCRVPA
jgi:hypothetical protein